MYFVGKKKERKAITITSFVFAMVITMWLNAYDRTAPGRAAREEVYSQGREEFYDGEKCENPLSFLAVAGSGQSCWDATPEELARVEYEAKLAVIEAYKN